MDINDKLVELILAETNSTIDTQAGMATTGNAYYDGLPKGIKPEVADKVNGYNVEFLAAQGMAAGQMGVQQFADPNYGESDFTVTTSIPNMEFNSRVEREVTIGEEKYTNYLTSSVAVQSGVGDDDILMQVARQVGDLSVENNDEDEDAA